MLSRYLLHPNAVMLLSLAIPLLGCTLAVIHNNPAWLVLLAPLIIWMEGGVFLIFAALFVTSLIAGWGHG